MIAKSSPYDSPSTEPLATSVAEPRLQRPIFIAGAGRSGTTLLRSLLSAHSRIAVTPETHFLLWAEKWGLPERDGPLDFDQFWERYTGTIRFRDLGVDPDRCRELIRHVGRPTFHSIFKAMLAAYGEWIGKPRIGEKTPDHVHFIPHLLSWFPDARILVLRRDPRAVVASQMRSPWVKNRITPLSVRNGIAMGSYPHQVAYYAEDWARMYGTIVPASSSDPRVLVVPYEALVQDVEGELRQICAFLGEAFEPAMLDDRSDETVPIPASTPDLKNTQWREWRQEHHARTLQPVSTQSLDKWKDQLTEWEVAMVEGCCARGMQAAGYVPTLPASRRRVGRAAVKTLLSVEAAEAGLRGRMQRARRRVRKLLRAIR